MVRQSVPGPEGLSIDEADSYYEPDMPFVFRMVRQAGPGARIAFVAVSVMLLALLSITFTRVVGSAAVLWLPNAFGIALLTATPHVFVRSYAFAHALGVVVANLIYGDPIWLCLSFAAVNVCEVLFGYALYRRLLGTGLTHHGEGNYLRFLVVVTATAALSAVPGGFIFHYAFGAVLWPAVLEWALASAVSLTAFIPAFQWLRVGRASDYTFGRQQTLWTVACTLVLMITLPLIAQVDNPASGLFFLELTVIICAMRMGRAGMITVTTIFAVLVAFTTVARVARIVPTDELGISEEILTFAAIFFAVVVAANLLTTMISRLIAAEEKQRQLYDQQTEFISVISHETLTPINVISGLLHVMRTRTENADDLRRIDTCTRAAEALAFQAKQFLMITQSSGGHLWLRPKDASVRDLLSRWAEVLRAEIDQRGKTLEVDLYLPEPDLFVEVDTDRLDQIIYNLASNAVKFSDAGTIHLRALDLGKKVRLDIRDEGIGISREDTARVFDRFWQGDRGLRRTYTGLGVGLYVSQRLAKAMDGQISCNPAEGGGTVFSVSLPKAGRGV